MERIVLIWENAMVSRSALIVSLAAAASVCLFFSLYLPRSETPAAAFAVVPLALAASLAAARMLHWYGYTESYPSFQSAMTNPTIGGFALLGAFAGCLLAALVTRILFLHRNLPQMLDCMCLAGSAGIALGRLASFFDSSDRGQIVQGIQSMPWVYPLVNTVSGSVEYRLATFLLQAMFTGGLFLVLLVYFLTGIKRPRRHGNVTLLFALCYGSAEVILDSTRYDSMYFRSNGFVSIIQVLGAAALAAVIVIFSVRMIKARGFRRWYIGLWLAIAALMGVAGYMEYHVQRHGNEALFAYSVMGSCLAALVLLALVPFWLTGEPKKKTGRFLAAK